jgi:hypothetical protein
MEPNLNFPIWLYGLHKALTYAGTMAVTQALELLAFGDN